MHIMQWCEKSIRKRARKCYFMSMHINCIYTEHKDVALIIPVRRAALTRGGGGHDEHDHDHDHQQHDPPETSGIIIINETKIIIDGSNRVSTYHRYGVISSSWLLGSPHRE